jgi:hypothetical protein
MMVFGPMPSMTTVQVLPSVWAVSEVRRRLEWREADTQ